MEWCLSITQSVLLGVSGRCCQPSGGDGTDEEICWNMGGCGKRALVRAENAPVGRWRLVVGNRAGLAGWLLTDMVLSADDEKILLLL